MNQDQRKFLITQVENTCQKQIGELKEQIPDKPSLNNYLIASFLDNTIQFSDIEALKFKMRKAVLKMGHNDILVKEETEYWGHRNRDDKEQPIVQVHAEDLFVLPENYKTALAEYEQKKKAIKKQIEALEYTEKTIVMKLQIGSSATLEKLVMQVDNMGDLNLMNSQLLLGGPGE